MAAAVLSLYMLVLAVAEVPACRRWMADELSAALADVLGTEVAIGDVELGLWNRVLLRDVIIKDRRGEVMLSAGLLTGKVQLRSLAAEQLVVRTFSMLDAEVRLYKERPDGPANYQFVIDALKSDDDTASKPLNLRIGSLNLRRIQVSYDERYQAPIKAGLDPHHLAFSQIDAHVSLRHLQPDSLSVRLRHLSLAEKSGLHLRHLAFVWTVGRTESLLQGLSLQLGNSVLRMPRLHLRYPTADGDWRRVMAGLESDEAEVVARFVPADFTFVPALSDPTVASLPSLVWRSGFRYRGGRLLLRDVQAGVSDDALTLRAPTAMINVGGGKLSAVAIDRLQIDALGPRLSALCPETLADSSLLCSLHRLGRVELAASGGYDAAASNAHLKMQLATAVGDVDLLADYANQQLTATTTLSQLSPAALLARPSLPSDIQATARLHARLPERGEATARIHLQVDNARLNGQPWEALPLSLDADYRWPGRDATPAALLAALKEGDADLHFHSAAPSLAAQLSARLSLAQGRPAAISFDGRIDRLCPSRLLPSAGNAAASLPGYEYSGSLHAVLHQCDGPLQQLQAEIGLTDLHIAAEGKTPFHLDRFDVSLQPQLEREGQSDLRVRSDLLDVDATGLFDLAALDRQLRSMAITALPALAPMLHLQEKGGTPASLPATDDALDVNRPLTVGKDALAASDRRANPGRNADTAGSEPPLLHARLHLRDTHLLTQLVGGATGFVPNGADVLLHLGGSPTDRSYLTVGTDSLHLGDATTLGRTSLYVEGAGTDYSLLLQTVKEMAGKPYRIEADARTENGELPVRLSWREAERSGPRYDGSLFATLRFDEPMTSLPEASAHLYIHPTEFYLADSLWQVSPAFLAFNQGSLTLGDVGIASGHHSLRLRGRLTPEANDSLVAQLSDLDVAYILDLVGFDDVSFAGFASGRAVLKGKPTEPEVVCRLTLPQFWFNDCAMGKTDIAARWQNDKGRLLLDADMSYPYGKDTSRTTVKGYVGIREKALRLDMTTHETDLLFLNRYVDGIFTHFGGRATGPVTLYGGFKSLDLAGKVSFKAIGTLPITGVGYTLQRGIMTMRPGEFRFEKVALSDGAKGRGTVNGSLYHTHLKNLRYDFNIQADRLLCYNRPDEPDLPFYSTAYGTGKVHVSGQPGRLDCDINLTTAPGTTFVYKMSETGAGPTADNPAFRFRDKATVAATPPLIGSGREVVADTTGGKTAHSLSVAPPPTSGGTDIHMNLLITATPQASFKVITDARSGDNLTAYGSGNIRVEYHNLGGFELYGTYNLTRGTYRFSVQDIIRRDLSLQNGSSVSFTGDPQEGTLNMQAVYTVTGVHLTDLGYGAGFSDKSIRVGTILHIGGRVSAPRVSFDLNLEGVSEEEKQMVLNLIATEEDMNRQALYLLGVGRFYNASAGGIEQNTGEAEGKASQSTAAMRSFLSTTLTGQLNNAISNALGARSHWSFGTQVTPGTVGWSDLEVDGLLQGRLLNDRLIINGQFGYRDASTYAAQSNFIGDFDIRYLLNPSGGISLKAYSETTDRYFTRTSLTTQGIGLSVQRDFGRFSQLFRPTRTRAERRLKRTAARIRKAAARQQQAAAHQK